MSVLTVQGWALMKRTVNFMWAQMTILLLWPTMVKVWESIKLSSKVTFNDTESVHSIEYLNDKIFVQELDTFSLRVFEKDKEVAHFPGTPCKTKLVYESYFGVKNSHQHKEVMVWMSSIDTLTIIKLPDMVPIEKAQEMWELEDSTKTVDPITAIVLHKPLKLMCFFKVKSDSKVMAKKIMLKTLDIERRKVKIYELDKIIPNSSFC